ncbi:MAG: uridine kinase [Deltaproteobacteria bacterium]|nr:uridine kinase [Deltaproteobacteria bacterium]
MRPFIVVVAGGTASGKTTIAHHAASILGATVIGHDRYYRDVADPQNHDFDHPDSLDTSLLVQHIDALHQGRDVELPVYDFAVHARRAVAETVHPRPIMVVEGILTLADPAVAERADLAVFVHADDDVRLARRIRRDVAERGRTWDDVIRQWLSTVRPAHLRYVAPSRAVAALVLDGEATTASQAERLVVAVNARRDSR